MIDNKKNTVERKNKKRTGLKKIFQMLLGGTILSQKNVIELLPFIFYLTFLAILYIGNTYYAEKIIRNTYTVKKQLKELRYEYITTKSNLMFKSKQSEIIKQLEQKGIDLKESKIPPHKIFLHNN
jgi:hypothetical protein